jgi:hypothetical protein
MDYFLYEPRNSLPARVKFALHITNGEPSMARKEQTLSDKLISVRAGIVGARRRIRESLDKLSALEEHILPDENAELRTAVLAIFRLQILSIRQEVDYFGGDEEA